MFCRRCTWPDQSHSLHFAGRQRPGLPRSDIRPVGRGVRRAGQGPGRGRGGCTAGRDGIRLAQFAGGVVRARVAVRLAWPTAAGDAVVHHHRPKWPHTLRPNGRGVLEFRRQHRPAQRRDQLRAWPAGDAIAHRRAFAHRTGQHQRAPERRHAEPAAADRFSRDARVVRAAVARVGGQRLAEHRRRLLRHDAGSHPLHRPSRSATASRAAWPSRSRGCGSVAWRR